MKCDVFFFPNGNTAVCQNGVQMCELQKSWLIHYAEYLESQGVEIMTSTFLLPNGNAAQFHLSADGLGWRVLQPEKTQ